MMEEDTRVHLVGRRLGARLCLTTGALALLSVGVEHIRHARPYARLPLATRRWFVWAAFIFLSGAIGMELVGGRYAEQSGEHTLTYGLLSTFEETLEMMGPVVFISALLAHLDRIAGTVQLRLLPD